MSNHKPGRKAISSRKLYCFKQNINLQLTIKISWHYLYFLWNKNLLSIGNQLSPIHSVQMAVDFNETWPNEFWNQSYNVINDFIFRKQPSSFGGKPKSSLVNYTQLFKSSRLYKYGLESIKYTPYKLISAEKQIFEIIFSIREFNRWSDTKLLYSLAIWGKINVFENSSGNLCMPLLFSFHHLQLSCKNKRPSLVIKAENIVRLVSISFKWHYPLKEKNTIYNKINITDSWYLFILNIIFLHQENNKNPHTHYHFLVYNLISRINLQTGSMKWWRNRKSINTSGVIALWLNNFEGNS